MKRKRKLQKKIKGTVYPGMDMMRMDYTHVTKRVMATNVDLWRG